MNKYLCELDFVSDSLLLTPDSSWSNGGST
jgi:hypothetical protein